MNEKNTSSLSKNLKYIFVLIGIVVLALSYILVFNNYKSKSEDIQVEIDDLQVRCDDLEEKESNKKKVEDAIKKSEANVEKILAEFDGGISFKGQIMDNYNMSQQLGIQVPTATLAQASEIKALEGFEKPYTAIGNTYIINTVGTYEQSKDIVKYLMEQEGKRKVPTTIDFDFSSTEQMVYLTINVNEYAIIGEDREEQAVVIPSYPQGTDNVFYSEVLKVD